MKSVMLLLLVLSATARAASITPLDFCYQQFEQRNEVSQCLQKLLDASEADRLKREKTQLTRLSELEKISAGAEGGVATFNMARQAFQEYRQQFCRLQRLSFASGSGAGEQEIACQVELTRDYIRRLTL